MTETTTTDSRWYAVQTYSGHENKVQRLILGRIEDQQEIDRQIFDVLVPTQDVVEIKNGKRVTVTRRTSPSTVSCTASTSSAPRRDRGRRTARCG